MLPISNNNKALGINIMNLDPLMLNSIDSVGFSDISSIGDDISPAVSPNRISNGHTVFRGRSTSVLVDSQTTNVTNKTSENKNLQIRARRSSLLSARFPSILVNSNICDAEGTMISKDYSNSIASNSHYTSLENTAQVHENMNLDIEMNHIVCLPVDFIHIIDNKILPRDALDNGRIRDKTNQTGNLGVDTNYDELCSGQCSSLRVSVNILKAYVGCGIMGLPFAFSKAGLFPSIGCLILIAILSSHSIFLLIDCQELLSSRGAKTYVDIGFYSFGWRGSSMVEISLFLSQSGFCCAYIIFALHNLNAIFNEIPFIVISLVIMPILTLLSFVLHLKHLAPFSMLANCLIGFGIFTIIFSCIDPIKQGNANLDADFMCTAPVFFGMAVYLYEAIGLAIPIRNSMKHPKTFKSIWCLMTGIVTLVFLSFGIVGFLAYGIDVKPVITTELPSTPLTLCGMLGLSIAMILTYPVMAFPIFEVLEVNWLRYIIQNGGLNQVMLRRRIIRFGFVLCTCIISAIIPNFGYFLSIIGAVNCNILAFILPSAFHLQLFWCELSVFGKTKDICVLIFGLLAMMICSIVTLTQIVGVSD